MNLNLITNYFHPNTILDIGANTGGWFNECKAYYPGSYIFSIEANDECEQVLKQVNPNYLICLLAKDNNIYPFYKTKNIFGATGNSMYKELTPYYNEENVNVVEQQGRRLDDLFTEESTFDLIKMDVQGAELDIIEGGINLCKKAKGILLEVALDNYNENAPLYDTVVNYMKLIGFELKEVLDNTYHQEKIFQQDLLFINENIIRN